MPSQRLKSSGHKSPTVIDSEAVDAAQGIERVGSARSESLLISIRAAKKNTPVTLTDPLKAMSISSEECAICLIHKDNLLR